jgi:hypothetical protein
MPDVWLRFIRAAEKIANASARERKPVAIDLLLTPWSGVRPGEIATQLRRRLDPPVEGAAEALKKAPSERLTLARVAISDSRVVACVDFETMVSDVVPLTGWWHDVFYKRRKETDEQKKQKGMERFERVLREVEGRLETDQRPTGFDIELYRFATLVGFIDSLLRARSASAIKQLARLAAELGPPPDESLHHGQGKPSENEKRLFQKAKRLMRPPQDGPKGVFLISLNRRAAPTLFESRATVKADAANRVFEINTSGIVFAVIDSGIDATHPAFLKRTDDEFKKLAAERLALNQELKDQDHLKWSRVRETYDFTILRNIIANAAYLRDIAKDPDNPVLADVPARIKRLALSQDHTTAFDHLATRNDNSRDLDWEIVCPLIRVPHDTSVVIDEAEVEEEAEPRTRKRKGKKQEAEAAKEAAEAPYRRPRVEHGTHVAGILAADLPRDGDFAPALIGMCPQLTLFDLRVFNARGEGDEYAILCAIEFVGWLNRDRSNPVVHGVNLSLALAHDVDSFACGQTPICEACNHLVGAGTMVVTAAGNTGFEGGPGTEKQSIGTGYRAISITDPGNADSVITVGSTHRRDPHLYGVSYFSARGPTGDGRRKPDILAPGEKITSTVPNGGRQRMDGTSMAAPHVAGAAALLMARYPELIGRPLRIKEILMKTATDLNREPSFQGAGLVDVLRALQSV